MRTYAQFKKLLFKIVYDAFHIIYLIYKLFVIITILCYVIYDFRINEVFMIFNKFVSMVFIINMMLENSFASQYQDIVTGRLQCDFSTLTYEVSLSKTSPLSKKFRLLCLMKDESSDDESDSSEGTYTVNDSPWLYNTNCRDRFLDSFSRQINELNGGLPSLGYVKNLASHIESISNMLITSEEQFLKINKSSIGVVTSLRFEGFSLSENFFSHFSEIIKGEFYKIEFINCSLEEGIAFADILDSCNTINLSIINCSITESDLAEVLMRINPYCIKNIDLSRNHFASSVIETLKSKILGRLSLNAICLDGTDLDLELVSQIKGICHE